MGRMLIGILAGVVLGVSLTAGASLVRGASSGDGGAGWVPDIEQVYNSALTNMFDAAGEEFTDPELKAFYDRLTGEITDSLSTPVPYDPQIDFTAPTASPEPTAAP